MTLKSKGERAGFIGAANKIDRRLATAFERDKRNFARQLENVARQLEALSTHTVFTDHGPRSDGGACAALAALATTVADRVLLLEYL